MWSTAARPRSGGWLVVVTLVLISLPRLEAQISEPAWIELAPDLSDGPVSVSLQSDGSGVQAWSFGLCFDRDAARLVSATPSVELMTVRDGRPPEYLIIEEGAEGRRVGLVTAVVLDFADHVTLPASGPEGFPVLDLEFEVTEPTGVSLCGDLTGSGEPVPVVVTIDGAAYRPAYAEGTTLVPKPDAWFGLTPAVSNGSVTASIHSREITVQGWSFTLCHDPEKVSVKRFGPTLELWTFNDGNPPDFYWSEEVDNETGTGIIQAVIPGFGIPAEDAVPTNLDGGFPALTVEYDVREESTVTFCPNVQGTGQPVELVVTIQGETARLPMQHALTTLIVDPYADTLALRAEPPVSDEVLTVRLYSQEAAVQGWSFTLCHTRANADIVEMRESPELQMIDAGEPPEFVLSSIVEVEPFVAARQAVVLGTELAPASLGPFPDGIGLLDIRYDVHEDDFLKFCDHVGSVTFDNFVTVENVDYIPRTREGAKLVASALSSSFVRGDADLSGRVNITDPIFVLLALFAGGGPIPCLDAADANDVARVDIADPIYTLNFLFAGGPPPPAPFPEPGRDLSRETALGCERGL